MTNNDIIRLAKEAGFETRVFGRELVIAKHSNGSWVSIETELAAFAKLVAKEAKARAATQKATGAA